MSKQNVLTFQNSSLPFSIPCYLLNLRSCFDSWKMWLYGQIYYFHFFFLICYLCGMCLWIALQFKHIHSCSLSPSVSLIPRWFWNWASLNSYPQVHLNFGETWSLVSLTGVIWTLNPRSEKIQPFGKLQCKLQTSRLNDYCCFIFSA